MANEGKSPWLLEVKVEQLHLKAVQKNWHFLSM